MIATCGYLLSYGKAGEFGRFEPSHSLLCRRRDRVVVRSHRGLEIAVVARPANESHVRFLAEQYVGKILRLATPEDDAMAVRMQQRAEQLFADGRQAAAELTLPIEILDTEVLLDGRQAIVHYLGSRACDLRPFMDGLSDRHRLLIVMHDLALPADETKNEAGCGAVDCGHGGCGSCSSGGCGSCAIRHPREPMPASFASTELEPDRFSLL